MTTLKTVHPHTGEELELELGLSPYEILNIAYDFLTSVKTPEMEFCEKAHKQISESYDQANIVLGKGDTPDTDREQFLASTFFSLGMKMGQTAIWPVGEQAIEAIDKAKAPLRKGGSKSKYKKHEDIILKVLDEYTSKENQIKPPKKKLTHSKAILEIESKINNGQTIEASVFSGWLSKYKSNNCKNIFD
jgi:hypothetical protein